MSKVRILLYHRVENLSEDFNMLAVSPQNFRAHMEYLSVNYNIIRLGDIDYKGIYDQKKDSVIITFDDGYYDWVYNALPVLKEYHIPATMFITTGNVGTDREFWTDNLHRTILASKNHKDFFQLKSAYFDAKWSTQTLKERVELYQYLRRLFQVSTLKEKEKYLQELFQWSGCPERGRANRRSLSKTEIQMLSNAEEITIGAHTITHPSLKWLPKEEQEHEILESKKFLEQIINKEITFFSYPFGTEDDFSEVTVNILREMGVMKAVVGYPGEICPDSDLFKLPRYTIRNYDRDDFVDYIKLIFGKDNEGCIEQRSDVGKINYMGDIENDRQLLDEEYDILIWGTGYCGEEIYDWLSRHQLQKRIIGFGDNDISKIGSTFKGYNIYGAGQLKDRETPIILVKGRYAREICKQMCDCKIGRIHWII